MRRQNIEQLKSNIYAQIEQLHDETTLLMLQEAITLYSANKDIPDDLAPEQQVRLQGSIRQADEKRTVSNEEAKQKAREWRSKSSER